MCCKGRKCMLYPWVSSKCNIGTSLCNSGLSCVNVHCVSFYIIILELLFDDFCVYACSLAHNSC